MVCVVSLAEASAFPAGSWSGYNPDHSYTKLAVLWVLPLRRDYPLPFRRTPLRADLKQLRGLDLYAQYYTARSGGDFYDVVDLGSRVAFLLSDIAGRREQAHVIAAAAQDTFRQRAKYFLSTLDINVMDGAAQLVQEINNALIGNFTPGKCTSPR